MTSSSLLNGLTKATIYDASMSSTYDASWPASACVDGSRGTINVAGASSTCATAASPAQANWLSVRVAGGTRVGSA